jgi:hypothetical protein
MPPPSAFLPSAFARRLQSTLGLIVLGLITLSFGDPMRSHSDALINPTAPWGILSLQFTFSLDAAQTMLRAWDSAALQHARLSLYWDMGFAPAYGITLAALTERFSAYRARRGFQTAPAIAWLPVWAALADWLENLFHLCLVSTDGCGAAAILPALGGTAALLKWSLLAAWLLATIWLAARTLSNRLIR